MNNDVLLCYISSNGLVLFIHWLQNLHFFCASKPSGWMHAAHEINVNMMRCSHVDSLGCSFRACMMALQATTSCQGTHSRAENGKGQAHQACNRRRQSSRFMWVWLVQLLSPVCPCSRYIYIYPVVLSTLELI